MNDMIQIIISVALGFAAGFGFKEIISKPKSKAGVDSRKSASAHKATFSKPMMTTPSSSSCPPRENLTQGYNLMAIESLFKQFETPLHDANSFSNLLKNIELRTYTETLQYFADKAVDSAALYNLVETESSNDIVLTPQPTSKEVILPDGMIGQLLSSRKLDVPAGTSREEKIQILVSYSVTKGLKTFTDSLGRSLSAFMERYSKGVDTESLYKEIMGNIQETLSYLTH